MANIRTFTSYVRDEQGNGIGDALVQAYAITNLNTNEKGVSPLTETYPDSVTGRWTLSPDLDLSPTGYISFKISRGSTVRWIEGDVVMQATVFMGPNGEVPLPDSSITDAHIGSRTVDQTVVPTGNTSTLTGLLSRLANRVHTIVGEANWYTAPALSLRQIADKFGLTGHTHDGVAGNGPQLNPSEALTWIPATADHNHDDTYYTEAESDARYWTRQQADDRFEFKGESTDTGGSVTYAETAGHADSATTADSADVADNALALRGVHGLRFFQMYANDIPNVGSQEGVHKIQMGTNVVTTNSFGSAWINYPVQFPNATRWIMVSIGGGGYRGSVVPVSTSRGDFEIRLGTDESRQVRINWIALGN